MMTRSLLCQRSADEKWPDQEAQLAGFEEKLRVCPAADQEVIWSVRSTWLGVDSPRRQSAPDLFNHVYGVHW